MHTQPHLHDTTLAFWREEHKQQVKIVVKMAAQQRRIYALIQEAWNAKIDPDQALLEIEKILCERG